MVLVDTSVWIRLLYGREPYRQLLPRLILAGRVVGHDLVYGELLMADSGGRQQVLNDYERLQRAAVIPRAEVADFVRHRHLHGRGLGWIDAHLLASALVGKFELWTADSALAHAAQELGAAYRP